MHARLWWVDPKEKGHLEDLGVDRRAILKLIFKKWDGEAWTGLVWLSTGAGGGGCCECGNETSVSIKFGRFLDKPRDCKLLRKDYVRWN